MKVSEVTVSFFPFFRDLICAAESDGALRTAAAEAVTFPEAFSSGALSDTEASGLTAVFEEVLPDVLPAFPLPVFPFAELEDGLVNVR